jgi:hypothetical protein
VISRSSTDKSGVHRLADISLPNQLLRCLNRCASKKKLLSFSIKGDSLMGKGFGINLSKPSGTDAGVSFSMEVGEA